MDKSPSVDSSLGKTIQGHFGIHFAPSRGFTIFIKLET